MPFFQTGQGELKFTVAEILKELFDNSDNNISAISIRCDVPVNEIAGFTEPELGVVNSNAACHPNQN